MNDTAKLAKMLGDTPGAVANSPLSSLHLPGRILKLLEDGGFANVGDLALRLEDDPKSILDISGIGPKALLGIRTALETFASEPGEEYREPVQSLGDQFKSVPPAAPKVTEKEAKPEKKAKQDKKKKRGSLKRLVRRRTRNRRRLARKKRS